MQKNTSNYLVTQLYRQAETFRHREFYRAKPYGSDKWESTSWADFFKYVKRAGRALYKLGAQVQDKAVLCSFNCPELLIAEYGCFINRMITVPIYSYSSASQFAYITEQSEASFIFVGGGGQYELAMKFCKDHPGAIKAIIILDNKQPKSTPEGITVLLWKDFLDLGDDHEIKQFCLDRFHTSVSSDIASIIYTSGTTGTPKGVIMTHFMFESQIKDHIKRFPVLQEGQISLSFLPMSHIFEKSWLFFCVSKGLRVAFNRDPRHIETTLKEIQPDVMCCVPRFWDKVYAGIMQRCDRMNGLQRMLVKRAINVGAKVNIKYRRTERPVPPLLQKEYNMWDKRLFSIARRKIGISNGVFFPTAGSTLSDKVAHFMRAIGIKLVYGYGMTETTATVSCYPKYGFEIGTVGKPLSCVQIKIDNSGEILLKGPTITPGYYKNDKANAEAFTPDGWFKTGDAGFLDNNGSLILSTRKKDLIKTSTGKFVSPQASESLLASNRYIDEVAVVGEGKKYISALVVPNFGYLEQWADENKIPYNSREELCANPKVQEFMLSEMHEAQEDMADYEKVKKITLLVDHFSAEKGEVTNTMKIRRAVISNNYAHHISKMYPEEIPDIDIHNMK
ncbi:MAG: long-chain fatty acid--CoA ligase [Prevotella sp.]|nr:long-chain fatty acid--CoA ligase [Prevotella sp.]MCM1075427.1 long-chain fatty acid--CoA ligase [Ruminococcus sp.]